MLMIGPEPQTDVGVGTSVREGSPEWARCYVGSGQQLTTAALPARCSSRGFFGAYQVMETGWSYRTLQAVAVIWRCRTIQC